MGINNLNTPFHLILGNNDLFKIQDYTDMGFKSVKETSNILFGEFNAMLVHDPCMVQKKNTLALCGHIHTLFDYVYNAQRNNLAINVGIETRNYAPISEEEIIALIKNTPYASKMYF
jgi:calcineurin-like phosphoesterase family protein